MRCFCEAPDDNLIQKQEHFAFWNSSENVRRWFSVLTEELILQVLKVVCWAAGSSSHCFLLPLLQMSNFFQQFLPQFGDFSLICCDLWRFKHSSLSLPLSQCAASVQQSLLSIKLIKVAHWLLAKHLVSFSFVIFSLKKKWSYTQC